MFIDDTAAAAEWQAHFLAKAMEADDRAAKCKEIETRQMWEGLAGSWRFMAGQVAKDFKL